MAILWVGGGDLDFPYLGTLSTGDTGFAAGRCRKWMCRNTAGWPPARGIAFPGGAIQSAWLGCFFYSGQINADNGILVIGFTHSSKLLGEGLYLSVTNTSKFRLCKFDGSTVTQLAIESGTTFNTTGWYKVDIQVTGYYASGSSCNVKVYVAPPGAVSTCIIDYTGDPTVSSLQNLDCVGIVGSPTNTREIVAEVVVADEDTRAFIVSENYPNAAGDSLQWTGAYTVLDDPVVDDADYAYVNTNDQIALYNLVNSPAGSYGVRAVQISARALRSGDSTPGKLALGVKSGGNTSDGSDQSLQPAWMVYQRLMTQNPTTSAAWQQSEIDGLQVQLKSRA